MTSRELLNELLKVELPQPQMLCKQAGRTAVPVSAANKPFNWRIHCRPLAGVVRAKNTKLEIFEGKDGTESICASASGLPELRRELVRQSGVLLRTNPDSGSAPQNHYVADLPPLSFGPSTQPGFFPVWVARTPSS
jgi:hypothetical protein